MKSDKVEMKRQKYLSSRGGFMQLNEKQVNLALEYAKLAVRSELSEAEAKRMSEILEISQFDDYIAFFINQIDEFILVGEQGNDYIDGGIGVDTVNYSNSPSGAGVNIDESSQFITPANPSEYYTELEPDFDITSGTAYDGFGTRDTLRNIENIIGSEYDDILIGNGLNNHIWGLAGNSINFEPLLGSAFNESLLGDGNNNIITDNANHDYIEYSHWYQLTSKQNCLLKEYSELVTRSELSELEAERMSEILEKAQSDDVLSFLINEIDSLAFQEQNLLGTEDSIRLYLQKIDQIRLLRADEEIELARKINDYYSLNLNNCSSFNITVSGLGANADVELLNSRGEVLQNSAQLGTSPGSLFTTLNAGSYYIKVYSGAETATNYNLSLSATPNQDATSLQNRNSLTGFDNPSFDTGVFTVGSSGQVSLDYLFDGGAYQGELAIFSLEGMEQFDADLNEFIAEAARRALSNSDFGHVLISDSTEGARFHGTFPWEPDYNSGEYLGVKTVSMRPGDRLGVMLVSNSTVKGVLDNPDGDGAIRPLFSLSTKKTNDAFHLGQIADVTGDGNTFVMEDLRVDSCSDKDYNDIIFQIRGATGKAVKLDEEYDFRGRQAPQKPDGERRKPSHHLREIPSYPEKETDKVGTGVPVIACIW